MRDTAAILHIPSSVMARFKLATQRCLNISLRRTTSVGSILLLQPAMGGPLEAGHQVFFVRLTLFELRST
jgi:hypothetical protein